MMIATAVVFFGCEENPFRCHKGSICVPETGTWEIDTDPRGFDIEFVFSSDVTEEMKTAAYAAGERWKEIIIGDIPDVETVQITAGKCGSDDGWAGGIDDILIFVSTKDLDDWVLGIGGNCLRREDTGLPTVGFVILDPTWAETLFDQNQLGDLIAHEIAHVIGFGTKPMKKFVKKIGGKRYFDNPAVTEAYASVGGKGLVPLSNGGDHLDEETFGRENMTPGRNVHGGSAPMSVVTVAIMEAIGYEVSYGAADEYRLP
ncbi:hypothetical protein JW899_02405 [Candidatus Uhrbacteria bacterium]|nr:hypothetical protein [Candidatus Uhrbacteria bacterium]